MYRIALLSPYHVLNAGHQHYPQVQQSVCVGLPWLSWISLESALPERLKIQVLFRLIRHTPHVFKTTSNSKESAHDHATQSQHRINGLQEIFRGSRQCIQRPNPKASGSKPFSLVTSVKTDI